VVEHVLEDHGAALEHGQRYEARQRDAQRARMLGRLIDRHRSVGELADRLDEPPIVAPQEVDRGVVRDPQQPRPQGWELARQAERVVGLRQRLLHHVLAVDRRTDQPRAVAM
jgi:hypothetical protein